MNLKLKWYEWLGWLINTIIIVLSASFVALNAVEGEWRAAGIGLVMFVVLVGLWSWVLIFYGKTRVKPYPVKES